MNRAFFPAAIRRQRRRAVWPSGCCPRRRA
nr:MAG TPA: hypothetical protein [Caudoviricetes sp.]